MQSKQSACSKIRAFFSTRRWWAWRIPDRRMIWFGCLAGISILTLTCQVPTAALTPVPTSTRLPTVTQPSTIAPTPTETLAPPLISTPTQAVRAPVPARVRVYYVATGDGGQSGIPIGCGDSLVAVETDAPPADSAVAASLSVLFANHQQFVGQSGLYHSLWQSNLQVGSVRTLADGRLQVEISGNLQMGGECDVPRVQGQIEQTALAAANGTPVDVLLNGKPIAEALSLR